MTPPILMLWSRDWFALALVLTALTFWLQDSIWFWIGHLSMALVLAGWAVGQRLTRQQPLKVLFGGHEIAFIAIGLGAMGDSLIAARTHVMPRPSR